MLSSKTSIRTWKVDQFHSEICWICDELDDYAINQQWWRENSEKVEIKQDKSRKKKLSKNKINVMDMINQTRYIQCVKTTCPLGSCGQADAVLIWAHGKGG